MLYENAMVSGSILLGVIHITQPFQPGDYNRDHLVDHLDYQCWRETFSTTVNSPGDGADGNYNSVVDAADYVAWRKLYSQATETQLASNAAVPEPNTLLCLAIQAMFLTIAVRYRYPQSQEAVCVCSEIGSGEYV